MGEDRTTATVCTKRPRRVTDGPDVCACTHEVTTYTARDGNTRCWCCFGVKNGRGSDDE